MNRDGLKSNNLARQRDTSLCLYVLNKNKMDENQFVDIASLIGEPARARMLWNLLDGRAYTASELALAADISGTSASNHLTKLLGADLLKVEKQGRHRYYSFSKPEIAYVVESLASLSARSSKAMVKEAVLPGIKYCRSCYDHLAGYVGVKITEALEKKKAIRKSANSYLITNSGWRVLAGLDINETELMNNRRPLARQCLDWSERRPHLAGQVGAELLNQMLGRNWLKRIKFSRELIITTKGGCEIQKAFGIQI
jgi:DNA-binding transcriptional ArsR family regulator